MRFLALFVLCLWLPVAHAADAIVLSTKNVVRVYDGDTMTVNLPGLIDVFGKEINIRVAEIDTPELVSRCSTVKEREAEKAKGIVARDLVRDLIARGEILTLSNLDRDKYFRLVARVDIDGQDLGSLLREFGLADPYDGGTKIGWCGR